MPISLARPAALLLALAASAAVHAAVPARLTISQMTSTGPSCTGGGSYYPSTDTQAGKIAFTSFCDLVPGQNPNGYSELFTMSSDGSNLRQLTHTPSGLGVAEPDMSQSGARIVFMSSSDFVPGGNTDGNFEIYLINADGTGLQQLTHTTGGRTQYGFAGNSHPIFDPSAQHITFSSDRDLVPGGNADGNNDLFVMNLDGSGLRQLTFTTGGWGVGQGVLDKTGQHVLFDADRDLIPGQNADLGGEIFSMNIDGTGLKQLTHAVSGPTQGGSSYARWTPDGQSIFFGSDADFTGGNADSSEEVFHMNADGSGLVQVTSCGAGGFGAVPWGSIAQQGRTMTIESDCDLVPGGNTDRNGEIYLETWTPGLFAKAPARSAAVAGSGAGEAAAEPLPAAVRRPVVPRW